MLWTESPSPRAAPSVGSSCCQENARLRRIKETCSSNLACWEEGVAENYKIKTCATFEITESVGKETTLNIQSFQTSQICHTIALTMPPPRTHWPGLSFNHQIPHTSSNESGGSGKPNKCKKKLQTGSTNLRWRKRWSTDSQFAWHRTHVVVGSLLHLLTARFSKVRILSLQMSQLKMLTFYG